MRTTGFQGSKMYLIKRRVRTLMQSRGWNLVRYPATDLDDDLHSLVAEVSSFTTTSPERIFALREASRYLARASIPGAIVECGVWRGGSMMVVAKTLLEVDDTSRDLFLFDTFAGMTPSADVDRRSDGKHATELMAMSDPDNQDSIWRRASLPGVRDAMESTGYPMSRVHLVQGDVLVTVPARAPEQIALLRLDTDWYESTRHELDHLYPRISDRGVLLIDDYGAWAGAAKATDEFLAGPVAPVLLNRIDDTGRLAIVHNPRR